MSHFSSTNSISSLVYESSKDARFELLSEHIGVTVIRLVSDRGDAEEVRQLLLDECRHDMEQAPVIKSVHQNFSQKRVSKQNEQVTAFKEKLETLILNELYEKHGFIPTSGLHFESPNLQKYEYTETNSLFAIPPHVDYKACVEVIAILLLEGPSLFYIAEDRECKGEKGVEASVMDIILMRGYMFQGIEKRPIHYVKKIPKGVRRVTLGFRMMGDNQTDINNMEKALHSP